MFKQAGVTVVGLLMSAGTMAEAAKQPIPPLYLEVARDNRVPSKLFFAMILNESRSATKNRHGRSVLPWPWTVNYRGTPHFFKTKKQAYHFVARLNNDGDSNFDVGLGQINWKWHREKFGNSLWDALDPRKNLKVAARYLRKQYERPECNTWEKAVGCYHRPAQGRRDKRIAQRYALKVISLWSGI